MLKNFIPNIFQKKVRLPAQHGTLLALSGAVMIHTDDGNNIVVTPKMARDLAQVLPQLAKDAEGDSIGLST